MRRQRPARGWQTALTLVELMASMTLVAFLCLLLLATTRQVAASWRTVSAKTQQFQEARAAFETMTRRLSQATLNTYWDYDSAVAPREFVRRSELRFVCGPMQAGRYPLDNQSDIPRPTHGVFFQAPFGYVDRVTSADALSAQYDGLENALNTWGYYVEVNDDRANRPPFLANAGPPRLRYRLMEYMEPTGALSIYQYTSGRPGQDLDDPSPAAPRQYAGLDWFRSGLNVARQPGATYPSAHLLAENVIALLLLPKLAREDAAANLPPESQEIALAPNYYYHSGETAPASAERTPSQRALLNTKHQLPPVIQVTMVCLDEASAQRVRLASATDDRFGLLQGDFATEARRYAEDIWVDPSQPREAGHSLERRLQDLHLNYRIFSSSINLRAAQWSRMQTH